MFVVSWFERKLETVSRVWVGFQSYLDDEPLDGLRLILFGILVLHVDPKGSTFFIVDRGILYSVLNLPSLSDRYTTSDVQHS